MFFLENKQISPTNEEIDPRLTEAVSSIFENRLPIFLPMKVLSKTKIDKIFKANNNVMFFETEIGGIEIRARLITQIHKSYLEAMLSYQKQMLSDGSFFVEFKIYDLLKNKMKKANATNYEGFKKYLKELSDFNLIIHTNNKELKFGFIEDFIIDNQTGAYRVKFTRALSAIWLKENLISYKKQSNVINTIDSSVIQNVVRYLITYDNLKISIKNLSHKLSFDKIFSKTEYYEKNDEIRQSFKDENCLFIYEKYGISYDEERDIIQINRTNEVFISFLPNGKATFSQTLSRVARKTVNN